MWALGIAFLILSSLVAVGNINGCIAAELRKRKGIPGGWSNVPFMSLIFSTLAWFFAGHQIGAWAFLPALLDPGSLMTIMLPWILVKEFRKRE